MRLIRRANQMRYLWPVFRIMKACMLVRAMSTDASHQPMWSTAYKIFVFMTIKDATAMPISAAQSTAKQFSVGGRKLTVTTKPYDIPIR